MIFTKGKGKLNKASVEEIQLDANDNKYELTDKKSKVNDSIYNISKYKVNKHAYIFNQKKLTTLWGCRPHNHQGYNKDEFNVKHPTVKPLQIMERLIEMTTTEGQIVLDPFMGSGSTGIATHSLKRDFLGFELLEEYYNIAEKRLQKTA